MTGICLTVKAISRPPAAWTGTVLVLLLSSCLTPRTALPPPVAVGPETVRVGPETVRVGPETVRTVAGAQYERGRLHRWLWGTHYRTIWATPVTVPVLHLATAVPGGFTPLREGGSFQTKNLRLETPTGRQYVLRSVDKDATHALPASLRDGWVGRLMKDQTSVIHPYGAYIVPALADAAGVYHTNPRLVYLGDDPGLGEFRASFANALYLLEERPDGDQRAVASFGRSARVVSSRQAFEHLRADNRHRVDARHYLRSRLFDMWLGDWSRREDQWRWATYARPDSAVLYRAIPRDRDHAFFKFDDGVLTRLISYVKANYQSFGREIRLADVEGLNQAARPMDKSLLVYLTAADYQQVADSLRQQLSDAVIDRALQAWPAPVQALSAREFGDKLRARRSQLPAVAGRFYELLARDVELPGTDRAERFVVEGVEGRQLRVRVLDVASGALVGERTFDAQFTRRLHLFGLGGRRRV
ncbi:hypothetical protein ACFST9_14675 [Hymenobacter monticola]|uniref:GWxTD domain-containing protein n=1 Tax=Hymenobacter monticola TaxID=1705399 RepID=A0ABY4BBY2_9BACT|nr:hypothetical protein [Hymenobacter monticola]UOE36642.1 hypothetical protein MTP16_25020 [Hymenobacter monticola]